tara:strand:+ start:1507 stop:1914 length:408 start_codon:yes stop_codon:yes gene_type:complete
MSKFQFEEYITINGLATPAYVSEQKDKKGNKRVVYYEWDDSYNMMVELFTKKTKIDQGGSIKIKEAADNFKTLGIKCFPGNVLKRIYNDEKKISHFIVEVGFDYDKTPKSHQWKYWKIPFGFTKRINHITDPFTG